MCVALYSAAPGVRERKRCTLWASPISPFLENLASLLMLCTLNLQTNRRKVRTSSINRVLYVLGCLRNVTKHKKNKKSCLVGHFTLFLLIVSCESLRSIYAVSLPWISTSFLVPFLYFSWFPAWTNIKLKIAMLTRPPSALRICG